MFAAIQRGDPFFFELKSPVNAVGGFGFFERFERSPLSAAWEAFGEDNGAPDLATLNAQVRGYRSPTGGDRLPTYEIGCIMISQPVFFDEPHFVQRAADWQIQGVIGGTFDAAVGEGRRVWEECRLRAQVEGWHLASPAAEANHEAPLFGEPRLVAPRRGQKTFQLAVIAAYGRACTVSGEHSLPVLEAAHIRPYAEDGSHEPSNGLLLRSDIHRLFDRGLVTGTPDFQFKVSPRLLADYRSGRTYYDLERRLTDSGGIRLPSNPLDRPNRELLDWHSRERFVA
jgi:putative restriction endonuclease